MKQPTYRFMATLWEYNGPSSWHFITINDPYAEQIRKDYQWPRRGFGSIRVQVTIGKTTWKTSIFPEKKKTYLLPIKKEVREKEGIYKGNTITLSLMILE